MRAVIEKELALIMHETLKFQNKGKILHKVKICQNCLYQKFPYKNEQIYIFKICFGIFKLLLRFYAHFYLILNF